MDKIIFKTPIVYAIELIWLFLLLWIIVPILIIIGRIDLFLYIYIPLSVLILLFSVRRFYFYEDRIVIRFLFRKDIILLENVKKIIYQFAALHAPPIIIIKTTGKKTLIEKVYGFFMYRFELSNYKKTNFLLGFLQEKGIEIKMECSESIKEKINESVSK